ncbi:thymosin beta-10-like [Onychomys torridus]|uniref:thymosin beta-10-like n=1 Tax=Onychomys torridus TaxID=38674 RepID=UPI00167F2A7D|nr:thymosin beta-10-like [Onychomys torridus]
MADKPDVGEITSFNKAKLKKIEKQEKNSLLTKETIEQEKRSEISKNLRLEDSPTPPHPTPPNTVISETPL